MYIGREKGEFMYIGREEINEYMKQGKSREIVYRKRRKGREE